MSNWRSSDGAVVRALASHHTMWPGFESRTRRQRWVEFVVLVLSSERFFSGYSGFPLSSKSNISKFQFDLDTVDEEPPFGCATVNSHLFFIFIYFSLMFSAFNLTSRGQWWYDILCSWSYRGGCRSGFFIFLRWLQHQDQHYTENDHKHKCHDHRCDYFALFRTAKKKKKRKKKRKFSVLLQSHCTPATNPLCPRYADMESYHTSVNYDRPGECSPERDCL